MYKPSVNDNENCALLHYYVTSTYILHIIMCCIYVLTFSYIPTPVLYKWAETRSRFWEIKIFSDKTVVIDGPSVSLSTQWLLSVIYGDLMAFVSLLFRSGCARLGFWVIAGIFYFPRLWRNTRRHTPKRNNKRRRLLCARQVGVTAYVVGSSSTIPFRQVILW